MDDLKLCESDFRFMNIIWSHEPLSSSRLVTLCADQFGWKKSTTYTMLKKLCDKGFASNDKSVVTSKIPRETVRSYESERIVDQAFEGSLPKFLVSFLGGKTLSPGEAAELKVLIDAHKEGQ